MAGADGPSTGEQPPAPFEANTARDDNDSDDDLPDPCLALIIAQAYEDDGKVCTAHTLSQMIMVGEDPSRLEEVVCMILGWIRSGDLVVEGYEGRSGYEEEVIAAAAGGARLRLSAE